MATSPLLSLPEELIAAIAIEVKVDDLLHFALTCQKFHHLVKDRLLVNAVYVGEYSLQHDRLPLTTPKLLRLALSGSDQAWHLRALEHWGLRPEWKKWRTYFFEHYNDDPNWPDAFEDHTTLNQSFFTDHEYESFESVMRKRLHLSDEETAEWMSKAREGSDEPLKGMLMALAPRLDRANFIAYDSWQSLQFHDTHPLTFFCLVISRIAEKPTALWPPGFLSLRKISVCTTSTMRHGHDAYYANSGEVAPLFRLPNLKELNLTLLGYLDSDDPELKWDLAPRSSSVEVLAFYCCQLDSTSYCKLIRTCKRLRRFVPEGLSDRETLHAVRQILATEYAETLEEPPMHLWSTDTSPFPTLVANFPKMKALNPVTIEDLPLLDLTDPDAELRPLAEYLPTSLESIHFIDSPASHASTAAQAFAFVRAISDLAGDERYSALREVCIWRVVFRNEEHVYEGMQSMLRAIETKGVRLHVFGAEGGTEEGPWLGQTSHQVMHRNYENGRLTAVESDPRPWEQRDR
ncbi:hypothetical protein LTR91_007164 [Friedmanniomyces endolithicus]|uniref:F-box domain-containing protein n=1 Tax=Friedmanniomyces endolithicus TaxID=329885 RepID=A0AAN6KQ32_9PEZI|nr:hypothetical protein LTR35_003275 [Friedmanniomyces endolithicus]KAK0293131.1 hypothetical protein LTS00_007733 [Friedmanniomyces endolithicus]KAK0304954.1 hypothetical protein LTR01_007159 [Friedmanniomyces endolithicus]KAK0319466.1 hypothetical protein LTR82_009532 [Friedmanniomyces endolithicus]KAK0832950.1 hypothetical protein LTR73_002037 [Friedmanniomyces endolithicus]